MSPTSAATAPPASVKLPSGDTSGEGNTAGTDGQGGQAISSLAPADSRGTPSPARNGTEEDDAGDGHSTAGSPRSDALRGSRSDSAVSSRQTCVIGSTNSVGTQTTDTMVTRFLTGLEVRRLETDNSLPAPELGPRGDVASQSHSLPEQLAHLVAAEHARLQWGHCATDEERIAHLPVNTRDMLTPAGIRDLISDTP
ncbi:hypothetical protein PF005_g27621 [Phytophthora fragariae]|uniref:Uncharacterized protein n=1 Tax=Phytophthora fragariae TaxID=53985 RepID=A0A6A3GQJ2_9STRA|nr:hypothetical protein PF011_g30317 [Phytophthora fragariae]KAE9164291.1 hypothetical protein PF002_g31636 [Phytophthora fragariae]KAE9170265.1 hypothetical protein PF005_g27621 [Phytophthora fragariae]